MATRRRKPVRAWHFWRRAFWTRPALLVFYALLFGVAGLLVLLTVPARVSDARGMETAAECPRSAVRAQVDVAAPQGCLERIEVTLSGPHYRPGPGSKWWLEVDGRVYADDVGLSESAGRRLADGDRAEVLLWEGRPVVIEPSPGERVETDNWGHRGWLLWLYIGMFVLCGLAFLLQSAMLKRMTASGWWSVDGEEFGLIPVMTPLTAAASVLGAPALLGLIPLLIGGGVVWSVMPAFLGLALAVLAAVKQRLRDRKG
jgi:hypothetical protein